MIDLAIVLACFVSLIAAIIFLATLNQRNDEKELVSESSSAHIPAPRQAHASEIVVPQQHT